MSSLPWLTDEELVALTKRRQPAAQMRRLREATPPIPYTQCAGRPVVRRSDVVVDSQAPAVKLNWDNAKAS